MAQPSDTRLSPAEDGFERYYAEKLWEWIPPIYRHEDGLDTNPNPHVLRALVEVLAFQAAVARRSIDRLWEDQFIDHCDDWAVPYLADLVGARLLSSLNRRGRRIDVARTVFYRRRKGTPLVMEALIQDITGWEGAVVESFLRLGRTRHRLDPEPGSLAGPVTGTPPGGTADLRVVRGGDVVDGPFDDFAHTPDFRRHRGGKGRYNISKVNFHLYRLRGYEVEFATPVDFGERRFTVDPSGRDIALFAPDQRLNQADWRPVEEWQLAARIPCRLFDRHLERFSPTALAMLVAAEPGDASPFAPEQMLAGDLGNWDLGTDDPQVEVIFDPARGRFVLTSEPAENVYVPRYHYGFSSEIGAGTYSRPAPRDLIVDSAFDGGGDAPGPVGGFDLPSAGVHEFSNSKTYRPNTPPDDAVEGIADLQLRAQDGARPYVVLAPDTDAWVFRAQEDGAECLVLDGLWMGFATDPTPVVAPCLPVRRRLALEGRFETVVIRQCTLDPGGERARLEPNQCVAIPFVELEIRGEVAELIVESSIIGPVRESTSDVDPCSIGQLTIRDSIVHSIDETRLAIDTRIGEVRLERVTVFGNVAANRLKASEALVQGEVSVTDNQQSCIRFSAAQRVNAQHFESHLFPTGIPNHFFTSRRFGDAGYAQLSQSAPEAIRRGAENRAEIGAFNGLLNPVKRQDLETKVLEYLPFGLIPQFVFET